MKSVKNRFGMEMSIEQRNCYSLDRIAEAQERIANSLEELVKCQNNNQ